MNKYRLRITQIDEDSFEVFLGDVRFVIKGMKDLPEADRLFHVEAIVERHMREINARASTAPPISVPSTPMPPRMVAAPPILAEALLQWFTPKASCEATMGDLQELLEIDVARLGESHARRRYWMRVVRNVGPSIWQRVLGLSIVSAFITYMRGKFGV